MVKFKVGDYVEVRDSLSNYTHAWALYKEYSKDIRFGKISQIDGDICHVNFGYNTLFTYFHHLKKISEKKAVAMMI